MIQGKFSDINDNKYTVTFDVAENITINDDNDDTIRFAETPVIIETEYDDKNNIYKRKCKINLRTTRLITSLFTNDDRGVHVTVQKDGQAVTWFDGYVEPRSYNQDYESITNVLTVNCVDWLGTLDNHKYKENLGFKEGKAQATTVSLVEILRNILPSGLLLAPRWLYYNDGTSTPKEVLQNIYFSEYFAYGDDEDNWYNEEEMLAEILKYLNVNLAMVSDSFFLFPPVTQSEQGAYNVYNLETGASVTALSNTLTTVDKDDVSSDDMQISYNDIVKKQFTKCSLITLGKEGLDMFNGDDITSDFVNLNTLLYTADGEDKNIKHYGIKICKNDKWRFRYIKNQWQNPNHSQNYEIGDYTTLTEYDQDNLAINQNKILQTMCKNRLAPVLLKIGNTDMSRWQDVNEMGDNDFSVRELSTSPTIYIPYNGIQVSSSYPTATDGEAFTDNLARIMLNDGGMIEYTGNTDVADLRPESDIYDNYIIVSGKIQFFPANQQLEGYANGQWWSDIATDENGVIVYCRDYINHTPVECGQIIGATVERWQAKPRNGETKVVRTYHDEYPQFFTNKQNVKNGVNYTPVIDNDGYMSTYLPKVFNSGNYDGVKFRITQYIKDVPVLVCQCKIGDKYLVEVKKNTSPTSFETKYLWLTQNEAYTQYNIPTGKLTFCVTISPNNDSNFFGQSYDFTDNEVSLNYIGERGIAIPIKKTDNLQGKMQFKVIKTFYYNPTYGQYQPDVYNSHYYTNWEYDHITESLSERIGSVMIEQFQVKIITGLKFEDEGSDNNSTRLLHYNEENTNQEDQVNYDFASRLTLKEYMDKKITLDPAYNYPYVKDKNGVLQYNRKVTDTISDREDYLEEMFIQDTINAKSTPKRTIDVTLWHDHTHAMNQVPYVKNFAFNYLDGTYHIQEESIDVKQNMNTLKLVEN